MSSVTVPSSATFLDKVKFYSNLLWEKLRLRFARASEAFQERVRWERTVIDNSKVARAKGQAVFVLAGFLFSEENERPRAIYEGINQVPGGSDHFQEKDLGSNEWFKLGEKKYFVKLLPKKYRLKGMLNE